MEDWTIGWIGTVMLFLILVAGIVTGVSINQQQQIEFEQNCVVQHKSVIYENVNDNLVSECK